MNKLIMGLMLLVMLIAFSTPAMGACSCTVATGPCPCACGTSGLIEGTVYTSGGEPPSSSERIYHWDFDEIPAGADIKWARLYWHIWMPGDRTVATFCNANGCTDRTIDMSDKVNCNQNENEGFYYGGYGTGWVYWNVTDLVTSGANNATVDNAPPGYPAGDGRTFQMYLVVVYEKAGYPQTNYWINQGYTDLTSGQSHTTNFAGDASDSTSGTLWQLGLAHNALVNIRFNTNLVAATTGQGSYGLLEEYEIPAGWINTASGNTMTWEDVADDHHHPVLAIFMDRRPAGKDLIVEEVGFNPETPSPDQNFAVTATVKNRGTLDITNSFNVRLYVNGVPNSTDYQVTSLGAGSSTPPISFPDVNLPEGCYEFKVVADVGDAIIESNEGNNASTNPYQVGYVIIVESNSDFDRLVSEGRATKVGATYYIEDQTITNCAGDGITIKNTNVPYVIDNCMIYDCTGSGVFLNNVDGGTVTGCTIYGNQHYGIKVGEVPLDSTDPTSVDVTCNTVYQNYVDGIDLVGVDCTVKGNTVRDNAIYGIYVFGDDNKIYNNTIEDNDDYGIKLYGSSGNDIYQNDISNNNGDGVQGSDDATTNTWRTPTQVNYCYSGATHMNFIGNYWNDHTSPDANGDGIVDSPYELDGGSAQDYYPLRVEWRLCGDVNRDGGVNFGDMGKIKRCVLNHERPCNPCVADVNCDGDVNFGDMGKLKRCVLNHEPLNCCCEPLECPSCS